LRYVQEGFLGRDNRRLRTVSESTQWPTFMPEQKIHTHEEVFKDHVAGQYDETIHRFRVPGGWIYTHTIVRFGSVDKNYVADTFVPDSS
jgi:hypothetical protein